MELLEKQGLCSQQQRQAERCASLPPSSLPRPKRNKPASRDRKLGEYGRLSDSETTAKMSNNSSTDTTDTRQRESPSRIIPLATRKLGEYGRLSDTEEQERKLSVNSNSDSDSKRRDSPVRSIMPLPSRTYSRFAENDAILTSQDCSEDKHRDSPSRSIVTLPSHNYSRLAEERNAALELKENQSQRESPNRLLLPRPPRKLGEYGRLNDSELSSRKNSGGLSVDDPTKFVSLQGSEVKKQDLSGSSPLNRSPVRKTVEYGKQMGSSEIRMTPINKYTNFSRLDDMSKANNDPNKPDPRQMLPLSNLSTKLPSRSFLPPPKKLSDYGCFEQAQSKQDSKIRLLPTGRRGSLHREQPQPKPGVRSLPSPNKYRIQF
jgi:hypothetical protein